MSDTTKGTGFARGRSRAVPLRLCAAGLLAAALGGRAPIADSREIVPTAKDPAAPSCRVLLPGSREVVVGHVDSGGPDGCDAFTLVAEKPCRVRFRLTPTLPGTDLDLCVQDRVRGELTQGIDRTDGVETTEIAIAKAGERLDLVVRSTWGSSSYCLEIEIGRFVAASTPTSAIAAR